MRRPSPLARRAFHRLAARANERAHVADITIDADEPAATYSARIVEADVAAACCTDAAWTATHGLDADRSDAGPWSETAEAMHADAASTHAENGEYPEAARAHRAAARASRETQAP